MSSVQLNDQITAHYGSSGLRFDEWRLISPINKGEKPCMGWALAGNYPSKAWLQGVLKQYTRYASNKSITKSNAWQTENGFKTLEQLNVIYAALPDDFDTRFLPALKAEYAKESSDKAKKIMQNRNKRENNDA